MAIPVPMATPVSVNVSPGAVLLSVEVIMLLFESVAFGSFVVSVVGSFTAASGKHVHFKY